MTLPPTEPGSPVPLSQPTLAQLLDAADGDISFLDELFGMFFQDAADRLDQLGRAVPTADWQVVRELAHALCGSAANLGAERCAALCRDLSTAAKADSIEAARQVTDALRREIEQIQNLLPDMVREVGRSENRSGSCGS